MDCYIDFHKEAEELLAANREANLYLLLDQSGLPGLGRTLKNSSANWVSLFDQTKEECVLAVAPLLVLAGVKGDLRLPRPVFAWLGPYGTYTSTVMMLVSNLDIDALASQLRMRLDITLSENMEAVLRFFDPRVFETLLNVLTNRQLKEFLAPADVWCYVSRTGKIEKVDKNIKQYKEMTGPASLDLKQEILLLDACDVDQVLYLLRTSLPKILSNMCLAEQYEFCLEKIEIAKNQGLDSVKHLSIYIVALLLGGTEVDDAKISQELCKVIKSDDQNALSNFFQKLSIDMDESNGEK